MGVILSLSGDSWSADETGSVIEPLFRWLLPWATPAQLGALHALIRKLAHPVEYAVLAALWCRALGREGQPARRAAWIALAVSGVWALVDEGRQATGTSRTASAIDVALDTAGAVVALTLLGGESRRMVDRATTALLWLTVIGGAGALIVNAVAGVTSIALWITTPVAAAWLAYAAYRNSATRPPRR